MSLGWGNGNNLQQIIVFGQKVGMQQTTHTKNCSQSIQPSQRYVSKHKQTKPNLRAPLFLLYSNMHVKLYLAVSHIFISIIRCFIMFKK